jgi:tetratricopeptide (TPR) repeat protein
MSYQRCGRLEEAIGEYEKALALSPDFEPALIHLGDVYFQEGRYREAVEQYQRYIKTTRADPAKALGWAQIAHVYLKKGDLRRAAQASAREMSHAGTASWSAVLLALARGERMRAEELLARVLPTLPGPQRGARGSHRLIRGLSGERLSEAGAIG